MPLKSSQSSGEYVTLISEQRIQMILNMIGGMKEITDKMEHGQLAKEGLSEEV